jgi:isopentenyl-diphosphate delta-isomerase
MPTPSTDGWLKLPKPTGWPWGVGSQRVAVENPHLMDTFAIRREAPDCLLFANLGAVQLNYGYGVDQCQRVIDGLAADALILHLNPLAGKRTDPRRHQL